MFLSWGGLRQVARATFTRSVVTPVLYKRGYANSGGGGGLGEQENKSNLNKLLLVCGVLLTGGVSYKLWEGKKERGILPGKEILKKSKKKLPEVVKNPLTSEDIPNEVQYLLIGGGTASFSAFRAIKGFDPRARVLVVTSEPYNPYMRPPLSKEMISDPEKRSLERLVFKQWNGTERSLFFEPEEFFVPCKELPSAEYGGVAVARGWTVKELDVRKQSATLDDGKVIKFEKCLIATGASPKTLPVFSEVSPELKEKITLFRNLRDLQSVERILEEGAKSVAVVGNGFLGSEIAVGLAGRGIKVTQLFKEEMPLTKILPTYLSHWTMSKMEKEGVALMPNTEIHQVKMKGDLVELGLGEGGTLEADHVIVAVGVEPNTELAKSSGLEVDKDLGGFMVNAELNARSNVFVAGDSACFYDVKLGRRRIEHHDQAVVTGRLAGENMTGERKPYLHQAMFWSDLGPQVSFEGLGLVDSSLPTVGVFAKSKEDEREGGEKYVKESQPGPARPSDSFEKGVVFYLREEKVVGMLLWNVFNKTSVARMVLMDEKKYEDLNEVAKLFNIHGRRNNSEDVPSTDAQEAAKQ